MYYAISFEEGSSIWLYIYVVMNLFAMAYWYISAWCWSDEMLIRDFNGKNIKVYSYSFNPFCGIIEAYISQNGQYQKLNKEQKEFIIENHIYFSLLIMSMTNMIYFVIYNLMNFLTRL